MAIDALNKMSAALKWSDLTFPFCQLGVLGYNNRLSYHLLGLKKLFLSCQLHFTPFQSFIGAYNPLLHTV